MTLCKTSKVEAGKTYWVHVGTYCDSGRETRVELVYDHCAVSAAEQASLPPPSRYEEYDSPRTLIISAWGLVYDHCAVSATEQVSLPPSLRAEEYDSPPALIISA